MTEAEQPNTLPVHAAASDEELLLSFATERDEKALEQLIHRYERPLYNYLLRYTGNASRAEELFQATFERVFQRCQQFEPGRRVKPWIYSIATHLAIDAARRAGRYRTTSFDESVEQDDSHAGKLFDLLSDNHPSPVAQLEAEERRIWVRQALKQLPDEMRAVVLLVYYEGLKLREIAEALHVPIGTVKSRLHRALAQLNRAWKRGHHEEAGATPI
jgi:RNA polymerase sigma-70 factor (ECF subfamily)